MRLQPRHSIYLLGWIIPVVLLNIFFSINIQDDKNRESQYFIQIELIEHPVEKDRKFSNPPAYNLDRNITRQSAILNKAPTREGIHSTTELLLKSPVVNPSPQDGEIPRIKKEPELEAFTQEVVDGKESHLSGLFVKNLIALKFTQQPKGNPAFVSSESETVTQFQNASVSDVIGLLAHNILSGKHFYNLKHKDEIVLVFGDGGTQHYKVSEIHNFERITLGNVNSDFLDLNTQKMWSARKVFRKFYQGDHHLTLQTCIEKKDGV